ncbi:MAG: GIY-YIG nuclease family protein [Verrucomicrobia bacterium]|nr:GIY-YIG nuclease family protein [Verrucomicrobiota bacterium]
MQQSLADSARCMAQPSPPARLCCMAAPHRAAKRGEPLWCGANNQGATMKAPLGFCVYVLRSESDGDLYIGFTTALEERLRAHHEGSVLSTAPRRPLRILYCELHSRKTDALRRERYLKTTAGKRALRLMLADALSGR